MFDPISIIKSTAEQKARKEGKTPEEIYCAGELAVEAHFQKSLGRIKPLPKRIIIFSNPGQGKTTQAQARLANVRK